MLWPWPGPEQGIYISADIYKLISRWFILKGDYASCKAEAKHKTGATSTSIENTHITMFKKTIYILMYFSPPTISCLRESNKYRKNINA